MNLRFVDLRLGDSLAVMLSPSDPAPGLESLGKPSASCEIEVRARQRCEVQFVFAPASNSRERLVFRRISVFLWNRINRAKRQHRSGRVGRLKNLISRDADPGDHFVARVPIAGAPAFI